MSPLTLTSIRPHILYSLASTFCSYYLAVVMCSAIVLAAVRQNGFALGFASKALRGDEEVVLAAVRQYGMALYHGETC